MGGPDELVDRRELLQREPAIDQDPRIAGKGRGIAGHGDDDRDPARRELNRLRLRLTFDFPAQSDGPHAEYLATLLDDDYPVIEQPLTLTAAGRVNATVRTFEVPGPGTYLFLLEEIGGPHAGASVTVQLRGHIERLVRPLMWFGYALFLAGLGLLAYSLARSRR